MHGLQAAKAMPPPARRPGKVPLEKGYSQMDWMRVQRSERDLAGEAHFCPMDVVPQSIDQRSHLHILSRSTWAAPSQGHYFGGSEAAQQR